MMQLTILIFFVITRASISSQYIADTTNGRVLGRERRTIGQNLTFYSFSGIPYAKPPIGNLRLASPVPAEKWDYVLNATEDKSHCVSNGFLVDPTSSEDCLYINVYTPQKPNKCSSSLPVLAWIYGGGFVSGTASYKTDGPDFFLEKDVVVVSFNYRLGVFGFLSTEDEVIPGNFGLKDQVLALKWIQNNIASFCGDDTKVTVMGQSAGASSVAYHIQSKQSKNLFHQAIMHSGTSLNLWALSRRAKEISLAIGDQLRLNTSSSETLLDGLRAASLYSLSSISDATNIANFINNNAREGFGFAPVIEQEHEEAFITQNSYEALLNGNFSHIPIIMGHTSFETNLPLGSVFGVIRPYLLQYDLDNRKLLPIDFNIKPDDAIEAANEIKLKYFLSLPISLASLPLLKFVTDDQFERAIVQYATLAQKFEDIYFYKFIYEGSLGSRFPKTYPGVAHGDDLGYFWRNDNEATMQDKIVRERTVTLWSNFIKNGNPTPTSNDSNLQDIIWKPFGEKKNYLEISANLNMSTSPDNDSIQFWDQFYKNYGQPPYTTY